MSCRQSADSSSNLVKLHGVKLKSKGSRSDNVSYSLQLTPPPSNCSDSWSGVECDTASVVSLKDVSANPNATHDASLLHLKVQSLEETVSIQQQHIFELVQQLDQEIELSRNLKVAFGIDQQKPAPFALQKNHAFEQQLQMANRTSKQSKAIRDHIYRSASCALNVPVTFSQLSQVGFSPSSPPQVDSNANSRSISSEFAVQSSASVEPARMSLKCEADRNALSEVEMALAACVESYSDQIENYSTRISVPQSDQVSTPSTMDTTRKLHQ